MIAMLTVLCSGVFSLLVVLTTTYLSNRKDDSSHKRALQKEKYDEMKSMYTNGLAILDKIFRVTKSLENYKDLRDELSIFNAQHDLNSPQEIIEQFDKVSENIFEWSFNYRRGHGTKVRGSDVRMISSDDSKYALKADEIYPILIESVSELTQMMKKHLREIEPK